MAYTYCTNKETELMPNIWAIDSVLRRGVHDSQIASYSTAIDVEIENLGGVPARVVLDETGGQPGIIRLKTDEDDIANLRVRALVKNNEISLADADVPISLGFSMNGSRLDLDNMEQVQKFMGENSVTETTVRDADNAFHVCSLEEVSTIVKEMRAAGLSRYQTKWAREAQIKVCTTRAELEAIVGTDF
jgi:hypothetical protein